MELERYECPSCDLSSQHPGECVDCQVTLVKVCRCAWCVQWSSTNDYCEHCGSVMVAANNFFAARVLRKQGVNQFSISLDLDKLDQQDLDTYREEFVDQKSVVKQILDTVKTCQELLFFDSYCAEFSRRLIKSLPLSEADLTQYKEIFNELPASTSDRLMQLAATPECPDIMQLAVLALVRCTDLVMDSSQARQWYEQVTDFAAGDSEYVFEALISLGHWRTQLAPFFIEQYTGEAGKKIYNASYTKLHTADGLVAQWMAVVCARTEYFSQGKAPSRTKKLVNKLLSKSLQSDDQDLRIASAMLLDDTVVLESYIDSDNAFLRQVSISVLTRQGSDKIIPIIADKDVSTFSIIIDVLLHSNDHNSALSPSILQALVASIELHPIYVEQLLELLRRQKNFHEKIVPDLIDQVLRSDHSDRENIDLFISLFHHCTLEHKDLLKPVLVSISQDTLHLEALAKISSELEFGIEIANNINRVTRKLLGQAEFKLYAVHLTKIYQEQLDPVYDSGFMYLQFLTEHLLHPMPAISNDVYQLLGEGIGELLMLNRFADDNSKFCFSPDQCEACFGSLDNFVHAVSYILQQPKKYQCEPWLFDVLMNSCYEFRDAVSANVVAAQYFVNSLVTHADTNKSLRPMITQYISESSEAESPLLSSISFDNVSDTLLEILEKSSQEYVFPRRILVDLLQYYEVDQRPQFVECIKTILVNQCGRVPHYAYISYSYLIKASMDTDQIEMSNSAAEIFSFMRDKNLTYQSEKDGVAYDINDLSAVVECFFESTRDFIDQVAKVFANPYEQLIESWLYDLLVKDQKTVLELFASNSRLMATLVLSLAQALLREKYTDDKIQKSLECLAVFIEHSECCKQIKNDTINTIKIARETNQLARYTLTQIGQFHSEIRKHCVDVYKLEKENYLAKSGASGSSMTMLLPGEVAIKGFEVSDAWLRQFSKSLIESSISVLMPVLGHFHNHGHEFHPLLERNAQVRVTILNGLIELLFTDSEHKDDFLSQRLLASEIINSIAFNTEDATYCISRLRNKLLSSTVESRHNEYIDRLISSLSEVKDSNSEADKVSEDDHDFELKRTGHVGNMSAKLSLPDTIDISEYNNIEDQQIVNQISHACELASDGDFITSVKILKLALHKTDCDTIYYLIARVFIMHDLPDQATRYLQQCLVRNPSNFEALELYTRLQEIIYHDYLFAIELATRILELKPDSVSTLTRLGSISIRLGDYASATRYIQQAMKVDPSSPDIYFQLGEILYNTQRTREAINNYKKAISCGKRDGEVYTAIARASLMLDDRDSAMRYYETATQIDDACDEAFYGFGRLFRENQEFKSADFYLSRAVELDEQNEHYAWELALNCKARGEKSRAFILFEFVANSGNPDRKVYQELAELCMEKASWYEAQDYYEKAIVAQADNHNLYFSLAKSYGKTESWGNAVGILKRAIDVKPDFTEALRMSANIYFNMERYSQAEEYYQRVLVLDSECQTSRVNLGRIFNVKKDFRTAAEYLIAALRKDNNNAVAHCYYATTLASIKEYKKSTKHFEKAVKLDPEYADAYVSLGNAYYQIENFDAAAKNYSKGAAIDPEVQGLDDNLSDLISHLQDPAKAEIELLLDALSVKH
ncbi:hypothetical protein MNBD_GAMMA12-808 [hydrothermal vent metagenome]|uniref:Uncharacterized protein n=1 Tax=hydrothermal vent metagenome TaxID=652676 RepID=A0A3B0YV65_9ZZZZ